MPATFIKRRLKMSEKKEKFELQAKDTDWNIVIPGTWHEREIEPEIEEDDDGEELKLNDGCVPIFAGDPTWAYTLNAKFKIIEWIEGFIMQYEMELTDSILGDLFGSVPGLSDNLEYQSITDIIESIDHVAIDFHGYWEGPGPVSGYNSAYSIPEEKVPEALDALWTLAGRLRETVVKLIDDEDVWIQGPPQRQPLELDGSE